MVAPYGIPKSNTLLHSKFQSGFPDKSKIWWGKGERNGVFIINYAKIYSNTQFLSTP